MYLHCYFFLFKQKSAYEMRISDWSSDVCSSDLHNSDPRWILPLLCRRGHVSKNKIGAIRIGPKETMFNIPRAIADRFAEAVVRTANQDGEDDSGVSITPAPDGPTYPPRRDEGGQIGRAHV